MGDERWHLAGVCGVAANPSGGVSIVLRMTAFMDRTDVGMALLTREHLAPAVAAELARHPDEEVRRRLAAHPSTHEEVHARLAGDAETVVRAEVARSDRAPEAMRVALAGDADPEVRRCAALRGLPTEVLHRLIADSDRTVGRTALWTAAVYAPATTIPPHLADLFRDDPDHYHRQLAIQLVELTPESIERFRHEREALARNPSLPPELMPGYPATALAENPCLPAALLETLVAAGDPEVHRELLRRTDLPDHLRRRLVAADEEDEPLPHVPSLLPDNATLAERLSYLDHPNPAFRRTLAFSPDLPADAVRRLAADPDWPTRLLVCEHHTEVPPDVLTEVAESHPGHSRWDLFRHPRLPADVVARHADGDDPVVRQAIATRSDLPPEVLPRLLADPDPGVRRAAAANPALPADRIHQLLAGTDLRLREAAASNPALSFTELERITRAASRGSN